MSGREDGDFDDDEGEDGDFENGWIADGQDEGLDETPDGAAIGMWEDDRPPPPRLRRRHDWLVRLGDWIEVVRRRRFAWGEHDCALFAAGAVEAMTGRDLAAAWRGTYLDAEGGAAVIAAEGCRDLAWLPDELAAVLAATGEPGGVFEAAASDDDGALHWIDPATGQRADRPALYLPRAHTLAAGEDWTLTGIPEGTTVADEPGGDLGTVGPDGTLVRCWLVPGFYRMTLSPPSRGASPRPAA